MRRWGAFFGPFVSSDVREVKWWRRMCGAFIRYVLWPALMFPIACYVPLVVGLCSPLT